MIQGVTPKNQQYTYLTKMHVFIGDYIYGATIQGPGVPKATLKPGREPQHEHSHPQY